MLIFWWFMVLGEGVVFLICIILCFMCWGWGGVIGLYVYLLVLLFLYSFKLSSVLVVMEELEGECDGDDFGWLIGMV